MKKNILFTIIGLVVGIGLSVGASLIYKASDIEYNNSKSSATNVEDALIEITDDLLENKADLLWTNPNPTAAFPAQTLNIDLSGYDYIVVNAEYTTSGYGSLNKSLIKVGGSGVAYGDFYSSHYATTYRYVTTTTSTVTYTTGLHYNGGNQTNDTWAVPRNIWGIKHLSI